MRYILHLIGILILLSLLVRLIFFPSENYESSLSTYGSIASIYGIYVTIVELLNIKTKTQEINEEVKKVGDRYKEIIIKNGISESKRIITEIDLFLDMNQFRISYLKIVQLHEELLKLNNYPRLYKIMLYDLRHYKKRLDKLNNINKEIKEDNGRIIISNDLKVKIKDLLKEIKNDLIILETKLTE